MNGTMKHVNGLAVTLNRQICAGIYGADAKRLTDKSFLEGLLKKAVEDGGFRIDELLSLKFENKNGNDVAGVSVVASIGKGSHAALHTWPEGRYATIDISTCGSAEEREGMFESMAIEFGDAKIVRLEGGLAGNGNAGNKEKAESDGSNRILGRQVYGNMCEISADGRMGREFFESMVRKAAENANMHIADMCSHEFSGDEYAAVNAVSVIAILKESHIAFHLWPGGSGACASVDAHTCGGEGDPEAAVRYVMSELNPQRYSVSTIDRNYGTECGDALRQSIR